MKLLKNFGKTMNSDLTTLLIMVGVIVLIFTILQFTKRKTTNTDAMNNKEEENLVDNSPMGQSAEPVFTNVNGIGTSGVPKNCDAQPVANPTELLPNDANSEWSALNPTGNHDLQNVNLLSAGYLNGINTVGSSLRNANLQVRSEPPNPRGEVGPFLNSTIEPDLTRKTLEIGASA
jgi:hypothetical protein